MIDGVAFQLVYQTFVFLSRSSISFGLPPLPVRLMSLPAMIQFCVFIMLATESAFGLFPDNPSITLFLIFCLIAVEGFCGGLA